MTKSKNTGRNVAIGAVLVGLAGYVAGILTAPKSGKETRKDIQKKAAQAKSEGEKKLKASYSDLNDLIDKGKQTATKLKDNPKLEEAIKKGQIAKDKARQVLSAVHEGDADDADLQSAIKEVKRAIDHLKTFAKKDAAK